VIVVGILESEPATAAAVAEIARRAAGTGARTEVVGVVPAGSAGDRRLLDLATVNVGHATVTRTGASGIEPADLDLALRYLPDLRVIVLVRPSAALLATAVAGSSWSGAQLIVVAPLDEDATAALGADAIAIEPPAHDPDSAFAGVVAALAARLDVGEAPLAAWSATVAALSLDRTTGG
jgi:hypothetical protein